MSRLPRVCAVVHGGAWAIPDESVESCVRGCEVAVRKAYDALTAGKNAVDAVEAAVNILEDDPSFDAGYGSVLNSDGNVEMDALLCDGRTLACGSVAGVTSVHHPITLARRVMEDTPHCMLVGAGADAFAREKGFPVATREDLVAPHVIAEWEKYSQYHHSVHDLFNKTKAPGHDTVGCVCVDSEGNVASGTSTGGITAKRPGRVGDSPLVGCGGYADNIVGAVSTTGHGESLTKIVAARHALWLMERAKDQAQPISPGEAAQQTLAYMRKRTGGAGGLIVVSPAEKGGDPKWGVHYTTERMAWAAIDSDGKLWSGIDGTPLVNLTE